MDNRLGERSCDVASDVPVPLALPELAPDPLASGCFTEATPDTEPVLAVHPGATAGPDEQGHSVAWVVRSCFGQTVPFALTVGTLVFSVNQMDVLLAHDLTPELVVKGVVTYLVPFISSNLGVLMAARNGATDG